MLRHPSPRLLRLLTLSLLLAPLAGCGQTGKLFLRLPPVIFPEPLPPPTLRLDDLHLPRCLYDAEMAWLMSLPPGASTVLVPEAVTAIPATTVTGGNGFQRVTPVRCALLQPRVLHGADLPPPTLAPAALTSDVP